LKKKYQTRLGPRKYWRLQVGWTDLILDTFWEQHKLPCTFVIKKHHVSYSSRGDFITFSGICVDANCKTAFFGDVAEEPIADNDVEVSIITADTISVEHTENKKTIFTLSKTSKNWRGCSMYWCYSMAKKLC